jgi:hypothetical protein
MQVCSFLSAGREENLDEIFCFAGHVLEPRVSINTGKSFK